MPTPIWGRWIDPTDPEEIAHLALHVREFVVTESTGAELRALFHMLRREGLSYPWLALWPGDPGCPLSGAQRVALRSLRLRIARFLDRMFGRGVDEDAYSPQTFHGRSVAIAFGCAERACAWLRPLHLPARSRVEPTGVSAASEPPHTMEVHQ